jgi:hypothetical protein
MEAFDVQRLDLIASQIEAMKKIILNILILSKNLKEMNQLTSNIQVIRMLSIEMTRMVQRYKAMKDWGITELTQHEVNYINDNISKFCNCVFRAFASQ